VVSASSGVEVGWCRASSGVGVGHRSTHTLTTDATTTFVTVAVTAPSQVNRTKWR
jgi:hypothetical protein